MFKRIRSIATLGYAVALAVAAALVYVADHAFCAAREAIHAARRFAVSLLVGPQSIAAAGEVRTATYQKAKAREFTARIEKRERPIISGSWRMCPSC